MKNLCIIFLLPALYFLTPVLASGRAVAAVPDSLQISALEVKLDEYFKAMEREDLEIQKNECDFIISSAKDQDLRQVIAEMVYDHYHSSNIMGFEGVAIHVYDKWFAGAGFKMSDEIKQLDARIFADFNRSSQLGCKAPDLKMQSFQGDSLTVFPSNDERFKVLYFYDTDCAKCKVQTILLRNLLNTKDYPVDFYAIYIGDKKEQWEQYITDHLNLTASATTICHLWDPQLASDFQRKYGVLQSPRLFLVNPDDIIVGRGLDASALAQMLNDALSDKVLVYGTEASEELYDMIFNNDVVPSMGRVKMVVDHIAKSTLEQADTVLHRQMTGDLMYYLSSKTGEGYKEGLDYLIDKYILSQPKIWRTHDDTLKIVGMAQILDDLLSKGKPGSRMPSIKVTGELKTWKGSKSTECYLNDLKGQRNIVLFYTTGCSICAAEKKAADELLALVRDKKLPAKERKILKKTVVFLVNVDEILSNNPELATSLFNAFDMSVLPFLVETDSSGQIVRRYISLVEY